MQAKMEMYEHKIDTGSDGNIMPINMFKMLFPHTKITDLNKSIDRKRILCTYNSHAYQKKWEHAGSP